MSTPNKPNEGDEEEEYVEEDADVEGGDDGGDEAEEDQMEPTHTAAAATNMSMAVEDEAELLARIPIDDQEFEEMAKQYLRKAVEAYENEVSSWRSNTKQQLTSAGPIAKQPSSSSSQGVKNESPKKRRVIISPKLIADRCVDKTRILSTATGPNDEDDAVAAAILNVTHLTLEGCEIDELDNLDCYTEATHLFLQHNHIARIGDALTFLTKLKVLNLANNRIVKIEGLHDLPCLQALDLSNNRIVEVCPGALPSSLQTLRLEGNPLPHYSSDNLEMLKQFATALPQLAQIDSTRVSNLMRIKWNLPLTDANLEFEADDELAAEDFGALVIEGASRKVPVISGENLSSPDVDGDHLSDYDNVDTDAMLSCQVDQAIDQALLVLSSQRTARGELYEQMLSEENENGDAQPSNRPGIASGGGEALLTPSSMRSSLRSSTSFLRTPMSLSTPKTIGAELRATDPSMLTYDRASQSAHAELIKLARHRCEMGSVRLTDDFDEATSRMRERTKRLLANSAARRSQMDETYAQRLELFKKGLFKNAMDHKTI